MESIETFEHNGLTIKIYLDASYESPREWDNLGTMVCAHRRYSLGDKQLDPEEIREIIERAGVISLPLYLYDHSGLTMNTTGFSCPWDSGQVGYIYVTKEKLRKEFGVKRLSRKKIARALELLKGEVETYDMYLRSDIYGYVISQPCEKCGEPEELDSCWGYYGFDYCKQEAIAIAENIIRRAA